MRALTWLAAGVTLATAPYVVLKISWLAGGDLGLRDTALMQTTVTPVLSAAMITVTDHPSAERLAGDALHAWVYAVVYVGFAVQGVGIAALFGAQVVRAWPRLFARLAGLSGVVLVVALAMSLRMVSTVSHERRLTRLDVGKHPTMRLD
jgi:hypothetical protein